VFASTDRTWNMTENRGVIARRGLVLNRLVEPDCLTEIAVRLSPEGVQRLQVPPQHRLRCFRQGVQPRLKVVANDLVEVRVDRVVSPDGFPFGDERLVCLALGSYQPVVEQTERQPFGQVEEEDERVECFRAPDQGVSSAQPSSNFARPQRSVVGAEQQAALFVGGLISFDELRQRHLFVANRLPKGLPAAMKERVEVGRDGALNRIPDHRDEPSARPARAQDVGSVAGDHAQAPAGVVPHGEETLQIALVLFATGENPSFVARQRRCQVRSPKRRACGFRHVVEDQDLRTIPLDRVLVEALLLQRAPRTKEGQSGKPPGPHHR